MIRVLICSFAVAMVLVSSLQAAEPLRGTYVEARNHALIGWEQARRLGAGAG